MSGFNKNVFINCPFDKEYEPVLQAILFCVIYLGFSPRIASENFNSAEQRLDRIQRLISESMYSIHDLSRCQARKKGEYFRLNMPLELGLDFGCRGFSVKPGRSGKSFLVLEERPYRYQKVISDLSGCDIEYHNGKHEAAIAKVRKWLVAEARLKNVPGPSRIWKDYTANFQEWHYEKLLVQGFSEEDIQDYSTFELLSSMKEWIEAGKPASYN